MIKFKSAAITASVLALALVLSGGVAMAKDGGGNGGNGGLRAFFFHNINDNSGKGNNDGKEVNASADMHASENASFHRGIGIFGSSTFHFNLGKHDGKDDKNATDTEDRDGENKRITGEDRADFNLGITADNMDQVKARADTAINNRINDLNNLKTRVNNMDRLSASVKSDLTASVNTEIDRLNDLKAKIDADTDISVLKMDIASITSDFRIYRLVIPQVRLAAVSDRIHTIVDMMVTIGNKFETRIDNAENNGHDVGSLRNYLSDYRSKIADAKVQADAGLALSASLTVDNGDQAKLAANKEALKQAEAKFKTAKDDLQAAREDAKNIIKGLVAFGDVSATSTLNFGATFNK